jgi:hypothetical protein
MMMMRTTVRNLKHSLVEADGVVMAMIMNTVRVERRLRVVRMEPGTGWERKMEKDNQWYQRTSN